MPYLYILSYPVPGGKGNVYFGDTGTAVTALAFCYREVTDSQKKGSYLNAIMLYTKFISLGVKQAPAGRGQKVCWIKGTC